jgi:hypothetical protein
MILYQVEKVRFSYLGTENITIIAFWINAYGKPAISKKMCERFTRLVKKFNKDLLVIIHTLSSVSTSKVNIILIFLLLVFFYNS